MRLTTKTRYGVRAVFDMAFHGDGGPMMAKDIARREGIPLRFLEQIFQDLKRAGLVDSRRGPRGGYFLKRRAEDVKLGDVVRALQGPLEELFSVEDEGGRRKPGPPTAREVTSTFWGELATQVSAWFDAIRVADLVRRGDELGVPRGVATRPMYFI